VHALILSCGLERYYELRAETIAPVNETILGSHDFGWLREAQTVGDRSGRRSLRVALRGLSCVGCVWLIEKLLTETLRGARRTRQRPSRHGPARMAAPAPT
jgi:P-type Cu2+ transporter